MDSDLPPFFYVVAGECGGEFNFEVIATVPGRSREVLASRRLWTTGASDDYLDRCCLDDMTDSLSCMARVLPWALQRGVTAEVYAAMLMDLFGFVVETLHAQDTERRRIEAADTPALPHREDRGAPG